MRASLTITGIEVELSVPAGGLETIAAGRYAPFLGESDAPVCSVHVEPEPGLGRLVAVRADDDPVVECQSASVFRVAHPSFFGRFDLEGEGELHTSTEAVALDHGLRILFALLAPRHGGFMLSASGVIGDDGAHVFAGAAGRGRPVIAGVGGDHPLLIDGFVMVRRLGGTWMAGSTPFWTSFEPPDRPREAKLARLWALQSCPATEPCPPDSGAALHAVMDHAYVPTKESGARRAVLDLAVELAAAVPSSKLFVGSDAAAWDGIEISLS